MATGGRHKRADEMGDLKEVLGPFNAMLFKEETMSPIFCKPKLIPLKTVTMEKLEKMQEDALDKLRELQATTANGSHAELEPTPEDPGPLNTPSVETNIWKAED